MNEYYFISGLPRSGSTMLCSILNQNPDFHSDSIASPLHNLIYSFLDVLSTKEFCLIEKETRKNILRSLFDGYHSELRNKIIFEKNRYYLKYTSLLLELFPYTKIICCVRNIPEILNSFEHLYHKNCFYVSDLYGSETEGFKDGDVTSRSHCLMETSGGVVFKSLTLLRETFQRVPKVIHLVEYDDLCSNPQKEIDLIYEFLGKPPYKHNFSDVYTDNDHSDKLLNIPDLHHVRKKVHKDEKDMILPNEIIEKYSNLEFWKTSDLLYE
jgi:sulfotransferase